MDNRYKEVLEAVKGILRPRNGESDKMRRGIHFKEVSLEVSDNDHLRYIISCLLKVCILALENENGFSSPRYSHCSKKLSVATVLELVDSLLPEEQLASYDAIEKLVVTDIQNLSAD
ncbi:hypothetical protein [Arenibacter sp. S6351L]|uniref:hypothetical protein n=1 Tax=Arenibacter sp. S6351L TaxID=2926407 RepID=UPI001FF634DC|nr:hypothetical protein [Arenibacter sp. S6351L]MCK0137297.1 hypothetical protein [Arenibacter sp. S6351L]|tara:strand:+ start:907 stop:1257 length:351 start_codon:yes stop_codon:yes gene_type:complete